MKQVVLLTKMLRDYFRGDYTDIPWKTIALIVPAIFYVVNPVDLIPDFIPVVGWLDDAAVVALAVGRIQHQIQKYLAWKGAGPSGPKLLRA